MIEVWSDCSVYQACRPGSSTVLPINFAKMKAAGVDGVCLRKQVGYYRDIAFDLGWELAKDAGLKRTFYVVPFPGYNMDRQKVATSTLLDGSAFDPSEADLPPWDDVEKRHGYSKNYAIGYILDWHYWLQSWSGTDPWFYTAQSVWEDYYNDRPGWGEDWELQVANYRPGWYPLGLQSAVSAAQSSTPLVPIGWLRDKNGNIVPESKRYRGWQFAADGNNWGAALGVYSRDVDISIIRMPDAPDADPDPEEDLAEAFRRLRLLEAWARGEGYTG